MTALHQPAEQRSLRDRRVLDLTANVTVLGLLWLLYAAVRGVTADEVGVAMQNAQLVLEVQDLLGLPSELGVQRLFLESTHLVKAANIYYIAVHFPATIAFLAWVWLRHRQHFDRIRNTLIAVTGIGLVIHLIYPLAPPRMIRGFVDTAAIFGPSPYDLSISQAANQIAAMPSLHVGWAVLVAIGVIFICRSRWRFLALVHPAITLTVVVMTANHYWLDAWVAIALVICGWLAFGWSRARPARQATQSHAPLGVEDSDAWPPKPQPAISQHSNPASSLPTAAPEPSIAREPVPQ